MKGKFVQRNGGLVAVIRPADPALALRLTAEWKVRVESGAYPTAEEQEEAFREILEHQPYQFIGLQGKSDRVLDKAGNRLGKIKPGDSFVSFEQLMQSMAIAAKETP